jgi:hypothetical protein
MALPRVSCASANLLKGTYSEMPFLTKVQGATTVATHQNTFVQSVSHLLRGSSIK